MIFKELKEIGPSCFELLLLADPSKKLIDAYLQHSRVFVACRNEEMDGIIVLCKLNNDTVEIKNVAVKPELQGKGIGSFLINNAIAFAENEKYKSICIGTANSSTGQLYLYQKLGFDISEIRHNFFLDHYPEAIYENGLRVKHMLMLIRQLR